MRQPIDAPLSHGAVPADPNPEEAAALAAARAGDDAALRALLGRHLTPLFHLARRWTGGDRHRAEDLVQETLVAACRALDGYRGDAALRTWLFRILIRLASDPQRWNRGARPTEALDVDTVPDAFAPPPEHHSLSRELGDRIDEAMERLAPRQRTALHLRAVEGMSYAAIASVLGGSEGAARQLVLSARQRVRERLDAYLEGMP